MENMRVAEFKKVSLEQFKKDMTDAFGHKYFDEEIEEMISEAKEEGTYEEMKEEIEADIKRAKYLQTISIRKTK